MCGIVGVYGHQYIAQDIYDGLITLQHRGQDAAGMSTYNNNFHIVRGNGLLQEAFNQENVSGLVGNIGVGHVRYTTAGSNKNPQESQPFFVNSPFGISLVHNGNLTNYDQLKKELLERDSRHLNTNSDSEALINILAAGFQHSKGAPLKPEGVFQAVKETMDRVKGAYSVIAIIGGQGGLLAFRDPNGIRPLVIGKRETKAGKEYIFASETVALDINGFEVVRDVEAGEAVYIDESGQMHAKIVVAGERKPCIFEYVYIARPDSVMDKISVYKTRLRMGERLVKQIKEANLEIDVVVPVPDTSRTAALPLAHQLNVKYREGLIKNRYIGRTFIMPNQAVRKKSIRFKLNPIVLELKGKAVLLVDDSIVRGNTSKKIIELVRQAGAKKVYFASAAPPITHPCVYGVDMFSKKQLIAGAMNIEEICREIGADRLFYQTLPDLIEATREGNREIKQFCTACFDGKYPTPEVTEEMLEKNALARANSDPDADISGARGWRGDQMSLLSE